MADLSITPANVLLVSGTTRPITFGATVTAGDLLYLDTADDEYKPCDTSSAAKADVKGIALCGGADGQRGVMAEPGAVVNMGATVTVGRVYTVSDNAGAVAAEGDNGSGDYVTVVGVGITAANLKFDPIASGVAKP